MSDADYAGAERCAGRLLAVLPESRLDDNVVLVAYGGGKDSSFTLAFVRAVQLLVSAAHGETFRIRTVTNRHSGMPQAVMDNIDRAYEALGLPGDPSCEALLVDGDEVKPFRREEALPQALKARNRLDLLMTGHRTGAEARPMFCNACNLSMLNSFGVAAAHGRPCNVIVTGDSPAEQRSYYLWVKRLARRFGRVAEGPRQPGFGAFMEATDDIARVYFTDIYGDGAEEVERRRVAHDVPPGLTFFSIYEETRYSATGHWDLLAECLGFQFDDLAFSFTESDCGNPTLMAHLRGLKCERLYARSYREGLDEYVRFATELMRKKEFPESLVQVMYDRYGEESAAGRMRDRANAFARESYGLGEEQLIAMVYSPLPGKGERLAGFLTREHPTLAGETDALHRLLGAQTPPEGDLELHLAGELERVCGLGLPYLRILYHTPAVGLSTEDGGADLMGAILAGDPHKDFIETRRTADGPVVRELLSGR
ncbi:hypothetical protein AB0K48_16240 [Nonomuraea sp. NPDC055795]